MLIDSGMPSSFGEIVGQQVHLRVVMADPLGSVVSKEKMVTEDIYLSITSSVGARGPPWQEDDLEIELHPGLEVPETDVGFQRGEGLASQPVL